MGNALLFERSGEETEVFLVPVFSVNIVKRGNCKPDEKYEELRNSNELITPDQP